MKEETKEIHRLYRIADAADQVFHRELVRVYGRDAGDAHYRRDHDDAEVLRTRAEFHAAIALQANRREVRRKHDALLSLFEALHRAGHGSCYSDAGTVALWKHLYARGTIQEPWDVDRITSRFHEYTPAALRTKMDVTDYGDSALVIQASKVFKTAIPVYEPLPGTIGYRLASVIVEAYK